MEQTIIKSELNELVNLAKEGNHDAFGKLVKLSERSVFYNCLKLTNSEQDSKDLSQEIFFKAFSKIKDLKNNEAYFSWIKTITVNTCKNFLTRNHKDILVDENEDGSILFENIEDLDNSVVPDQVVNDKATREIIMGIIAKLPAAQRVCVVMYYYDEMSIKQIAESLEISENTVKSRLSYARNTIEKAVTDYEKEGLKLYGVSPMLLLRVLFKKDEEKVIMPKVQPNIKIPYSKPTEVKLFGKNLPNNGFTRFLTTYKKIISIVLVIVIGIPVFSSLGKDLISGFRDNNGWYFSKPERVVERYMRARKTLDYIKEYDCVDFSDSLLLREDIYVKSRSNMEDPLQVKDFEIGEIDNEYVSTFSEMTDFYEVPVTYTLRNFSEERHSLYTVIKIGESNNKPIYKIKNSEFTVNGFSVEAPRGAQVTIDGIPLTDATVETDYQRMEDWTNYKISYDKYSIPELFIGSHEVISDFMGTQTTETLSEDKKVAQLCDVSISETFQNELKTKLSAYAKEFFQTGFDKKKYEDIKKKSPYQIVDEKNHIQKYYEYLNRQNNFHDGMGYRNFKCTTQDISVQCIKGNIFVRVKQNYNYEYCYTIMKLVVNPDTEAMKITFILRNKDNNWVIDTIAEESIF